MYEAILGIDPGSEKSGYVVWDGSRVQDCGTESNAHVLDNVIPAYSHLPCVIELLVPYVMTTAGGHPYVPKQVGVTLLETGRLHDRYTRSRIDRQEPILITRTAVRSHLGANKRGKSKDSQVIKALTDRIGPKGTKANPGPLYGIATHAWQALAAVIAAEDTELLKEQYT